MRKTTKTYKNHRTNIAKNTIIYAASIAILLSILVFGAIKFQRYSAAADQSGTSQVRELILLALRGIKKDAPVDYRTGDVYFPEAKLYLPTPKTPLTLTYQYNTGDSTDIHQDELSVSTYPVRTTERLYSASNQTELFKAVPHVQACSRGIRLTRAALPATDKENQLMHTVPLGGGQTVFVYLEKACPELGELADSFKNVRQY